MGKTLIISQEQLNEILGGNVTYFDDIENDVPEYAGHSQVFANSPKGKNITGKDLSKDMGPASNWWGSVGTRNGAIARPVMETYTKKELDEKFLSEINQALVGQNITVNSNNPEEGTMKNIEGSENALSRRMNYAKNHGNKKDAQIIGTALKSRRDPVEKGKETRKNAGMNNQYQKAGGTKVSNNGKAHTKKVPTAHMDNYLGL